MDDGGSVRSRRIANYVFSGVVRKSIFKIYKFEYKSGGTFNMNEWPKLESKKQATNDRKWVLPSAGVNRK